MKSAGSSLIAGKYDFFWGNLGYFKSMPFELTRHILSFLSPHELLQLVQLSKSHQKFFSKFSYDVSLWQMHFPELAQQFISPNYFAQGALAPLGVRFFYLAEQGSTSHRFLLSVEEDALLKRIFSETSYIITQFKQEQAQGEIRDIVAWLYKHSPILIDFIKVHIECAIYLGHTEYVSLLFAEGIMPEIRHAMAAIATGNKELFIRLTNYVPTLLTNHYQSYAFSALLQGNVEMLEGLDRKLVEKNRWKKFSKKLKTFLLGSEIANILLLDLDNFVNVLSTGHLVLIKWLQKNISFAAFYEFLYENLHAKGLGQLFLSISNLSFEKASLMLTWIKTACEKEGAYNIYEGILRGLLKILIEKNKIESSHLLVEWIVSQMDKKQLAQWLWEIFFFDKKTVESVNISVWLFSYLTAQGRSRALNQWLSQNFGNILLSRNESLIHWLKDTWHPQTLEKNVLEAQALLQNKAKNKLIIPSFKYLNLLVPDIAEEILKNLFSQLVCGLNEYITNNKRKRLTTEQINQALTPIKCLMEVEPGQVIKLLEEIFQKDKNNFSWLINYIFPMALSVQAIEILSWIKDLISSLPPNLGFSKIKSMPLFSDEASPLYEVIIQKGLMESLQWVKENIPYQIAPEIYKFLAIAAIKYEKVQVLNFLPREMDFQEILTAGDFHLLQDAVLQGRLQTLKWVESNFNSIFADFLRTRPSTVDEHLIENAYLYKKMTVQYASFSRPNKGFTSLSVLAGENNSTNMKEHTSAVIRSSKLLTMYYFLCVKSRELSAASIQNSKSKGKQPMEEESINLSIFSLS